MEEFKVGTEVLCDLKTNEVICIGDYIKAKFVKGSISRNGVDWADNIVTIRGTVEMIFDEPQLVSKHRCRRLSLLDDISKCVRKNTTTRWTREKEVESNFKLTESLPFDMRLAKRFNTKFCKDLGLRKSRIKWANKKKLKSYIGLHVYGWKSTIYILDSLSSKQKWETFFHEMAHYKEHNHSKGFHEEMSRIYRRFELWVERKPRLLEAAKELRKEMK